MLTRNAVLPEECDAIGGNNLDLIVIDERIKHTLYNVKQNKTNTCTLSRHVRVTTSHEHDNIRTCVSSTLNATLEMPVDEINPRISSALATMNFLKYASATSASCATNSRSSSCPE